MNTSALTTRPQSDLVTGDLLARAGQAANRAAARHAFADYRDRKAANTIRRQDADLALFKTFLSDVAGVPTGDLAHEPGAWRGLKWGIVQAFVQWQLNEGYAVGTVNVRLSTVKTYAKLAAKAGALDRGEYAMIRAIEGYRHAEGANLDKTRKARGLDTRIGDKKAEPVHITAEQADRLKSEHGDDGQGRRDRLIMSLLFDLGMRVSELADLRVDDVNLDGDKPTLHVWRRKVQGTETEHANFELETIPDTLRALRAYLADQDAPTDGALIVTSNRYGDLTGSALSKRAIAKRVRYLGRRILDVDRLSPHDARHHAATVYGKTKSTRELCSIFGWNSSAMALRYQAAAETISI